MQAKRERWSGFAKTTQASRLVFRYESGVNINTARRYGPGKGGRRVVDHAPLNTPKSTTILSSIRLDGTMVFTAFPSENTVKPRKCLRRKASSDRSDEFTTNLLLWEKLAALRNSQLNKFNIPPAGL